MSVDVVAEEQIAEIKERLGDVAECNAERKQTVFPFGRKIILSSEQTNEQI